MKYREKYRLCEIWYQKVSVMSLFHLSMCQRDKTWTIADTATYFGVSKALVSENLKLAREMNKKPELEKCHSRKNAIVTLKRIGNK